MSLFMNNRLIVSKQYQKAFQLSKYCIASILFRVYRLLKLYGGRLSSVRIGYFLFFPMLVFPVFPWFSLASGCFCYLGVTSVLLSGSTKPSSTR
nr:MAG TPA: hypothetical protein [Caudoviricetes sp.]